MFFMKCGCSVKRDESEKALGKKACEPGDMAYCPKHGDVRLISREERDQMKKAKTR